MSTLRHPIAPSEAPAYVLELRIGSWSQPPIFSLIAGGGVDPVEMRRTFNLGLGMIVVCAAADSDAALSALHDAGESAAIVGQIARRSGREPVVFI